MFNEKKYNDYLKQYLDGLDSSITFQSSLLFRTKPPGMSYWDFFRTERKKIFFKRLIYFLKKAILSQVNDIFKNVAALPGFADSNSLSDLNDFIHQQGFPFYFHEGATATRDTVAKNFDYLYQLIFGQSYQGMSQKNLCAKYNRTFNLQVDTRDVQKDTVLSTSNGKINYFQTGLRGLVNPVLQKSKEFAFPATRLRYYTTHWYDFNQKIFPRHL